MNARCLAAVLAAVVVFSPALAADDDLERRASWSVPEAAAVKAEVDAWLAAQSLDEATQAAAAALWTDDEGQAPPAADELLQRLAATLALVDDEARQVVEQCQQPRTSPPAPAFPLLSGEAAAPLVRNNLRLLYARQLVHSELVDEAAQLLAGLTADDVVDPAALLFYQGVVHHRLLNKESSLAALAKLLENEAETPQRYTMVARLMEADLRPLQVDSLDEVARLMNDIERRLRLGRAGKRVRQQEDDVIAKLDKMIEEMEQNMQQSSSSSSSGGGSNPSQPMQDSNPGGGSGPGNVDPKRLAGRDSWGNLPPKERQEALQQVSKELPAHFREAIEEYFRKLARDGVE